MLDYVFRRHLELAAHAALLFCVGLIVSWPVVRCRIRLLTRPPLAVFRLVMKLIGPRPSLARMAAVIWVFNSVAIFIYMASGWHPLGPKVFGIWTGMNIGVIIRHRRAASSVPMPGSPSEEHWVPPVALTMACGLVVLALELPCFWFSLAMGLSMGSRVQAGAAYGPALAERALPYAALIVPLLLCSAIAEAMAIRGAAARRPEPLTQAPGDH